MTYCNGKGCALSATCKRWKEGRRIILSEENSTGQYRFVDCCNPDTRELYVGVMI